MLCKDTILVVDDLALNRILLKNIFADEYSVLECDNGTSALALLERNYQNIDLIILDLVMPGKDGFEVLQTIQTTQKFKTIPVVIITSFSDIDNEIKALQLGAADFITKPFNNLSVYHRVKTLIEKRGVEQLKLQNLKLQDQQKLMAELKFRADHDRLTEIYNKECFCAYTAKMIKEHPEIDFVIFRWNFEQFKIINDLFGKSTGDKLLKGFSEIFKKVLPENSSYGRLEADHFVCCTPIGTLHEESFSKELSKLFKEIHLSQDIIISVGIYIVNDLNIPISHMCDRANLALNTIKGDFSKHHAYYNESLRETMLYKQEIRNDMKIACELDQFQIYL